MHQLSSTTQMHNSVEPPNELIQPPVILSAYAVGIRRLMLGIKVSMAKPQFLGFLSTGLHQFLLQFLHWELFFRFPRIGDQMRCQTSVVVICNHSLALIFAVHSSLEPSLQAPSYWVSGAVTSLCNSTFPPHPCGSVHWDLFSPFF